MIGAVVMLSQNHSSNDPSQETPIALFALAELAPGYVAEVEEEIARIRFVIAHRGPDWTIPDIRVRVGKALWWRERVGEIETASNLSQMGLLDKTISRDCVFEIVELPLRGLRMPE